MSKRIVIKILILGIIISLSLTSCGCIGKNKLAEWSKRTPMYMNTIVYVNMKKLKHEKSELAEEIYQNIVNTEYIVDVERVTGVSAWDSSEIVMMSSVAERPEVIIFTGNFDLNSIRDSIEENPLWQYANKWDYRGFTVYEIQLGEHRQWIAVSRGMIVFASTTFPKQDLDIISGNKVSGSMYEIVKDTVSRLPSDDFLYFVTTKSLSSSLKGLECVAAGYSGSKSHYIFKFENTEYARNAMEEMKEIKEITESQGLYKSCRVMQDGNYLIIECTLKEE